MQFHLHHFIKAVMLGLFVLFFLQLHSTGDILKYVNPKYDYISKIAAGIFALLFLIQLFRIFQKKHRHHYCSSGCRHDHNHDNGDFSLARVISYSIIALPIVTGFTMEPVTLNASIAANKGSFFTQISQENKTQNDNTLLLENAQSLAEKENIDIYTDELVPLENNNYVSNEEYETKLQLLRGKNMIEMNEDMFGAYYGEINDHPAGFIGREIKIRGFVFKDEGFNPNQLVISRFMITHCIADASILGLLTEFEEANKVKEDAWLEIEGVLDVTTYGGAQLPVIKATGWKEIEEPTEPYVYPVLTLTP